jgi:hypothetical protein
MPDPRDPFANLDPSKLVALDGEVDRPQAKRLAANDVDFAPVPDERILELDLPPPRRGMTSPNLPPLPAPSPPRTEHRRIAATGTTSLPETGAMGMNPRVAFAAGMALALGIGFLPAHLYASFAERDYLEIRDQATHSEPAVNDAVYQAEVEEHETAVVDLKRVKLRIVALTALVWFAASGALGVAWLRLVQSRLPADE